MGRRRSQAAEGVVNPLQRAFGVYLRIKRNRLRISSQDMARSLGTNPTYYRLFESGKARIGIEWIPDIVCVFAPKKVHIDFSSLTMLLTGMAILNRFWEYEINQEDPFRELDCYSDFKELLEDIRPYFSFEEGSRELQDFLETKAFDAMCNYLETSPGQRDLQRPYLALQDVAPEGIEILTSLHRQLVGRRFLQE